MHPVNAFVLAYMSTGLLLTALMFFVVPRDFVRESAREHNVMRFGLVPLFIMVLLVSAFRWPWIVARAIKQL